MKNSVRQVLTKVSCCFALSTACTSGIAQGLPENWRSLKMYELDRLTDAGNYTPAAKAELFVDWMAANDWRSLDINSLYNLYEWISADAVDSRHFSARWTGYLTAPRTGSYTLHQIRQYSGADSRLKVIIDGQIVLDTTAEFVDSARFSSRPVELTTNQAVSIQVELVQNVTKPVPVYDFSEDAAMVLLTWTDNQGNEEIIPTTAFTPPSGFAEPGVHGLKGEYFGNLQFEHLRATRLDTALDLVWSWPPVIPIHQAEASAVFAACKEKLLDAGFLAHLAEHRHKVLSYNLWRVAYRMSATERLRLVRTLKSNRQVMAAMTTGAMARLAQGIYMLPGQEYAELLGEWSLARPQPRCQAGKFPGWGSGYYQTHNTDYYWLMGHFLQGPYWSDVEPLVRDYLVRSNNECNLAIAYVAAYATRQESFNRGGRHLTPFYVLLQEHLDDESVTGDARVTWLIARTFADEAMGSGQLRLIPTSPYLEEARLVAESTNYKFWALQETAARYASLGEAARLDELLGEVHGETPQQQAAIAKWRETATAVAKVNSDKRAAQEINSKAAFLAELERRLSAAQQRQNQTEIDRYQQLINSAKSDHNQ